MMAYNQQHNMAAHKTTVLQLFRCNTWWSFTSLCRQPMLYFLGYEAKRSVGPVKKQGKRRGPDYWAIPDDTLVRAHRYTLVGWKSFKAFCFESNLQIKLIWIRTRVTNDQFGHRNIQKRTAYVSERQNEAVASFSGQAESMNASNGMVEKTNGTNTQPEREREKERERETEKEREREREREQERERGRGGREGEGESESERGREGGREREGERERATEGGREGGRERAREGETGGGRAGERERERERCSTQGVHVTRSYGTR